MDFATHNGNKHPVVPPVPNHPALHKHMLKEQEPRRFGLFRKSVKLAHNKTKHTMKVADNKKKSEDMESQIQRKNTIKNIEDIIDDKNISDVVKYTRLQNELQENHKVLNKNELNTYNMYLKQLHQKMTTPPINRPTVTKDTPTVKFVKPVSMNKEEIGIDHNTHEKLYDDGSREEFIEEQTKDEIAINKAHDDFQESKHDSDDKLSPEAKVSAQVF